MNNTFPTEGNLSGLSRKDFQKDINDKKTDLFILKNTKGMEVAVTNYGCAILSIMIPDKNGKYANVILGHDSIDHVINSPEPFLCSAKNMNSQSTTDLTPCTEDLPVSTLVYGTLYNLTRAQCNSTMFLPMAKKDSPATWK